MTLRNTTSYLALMGCAMLFFSGCGDQGQHQANSEAVATLEAKVADLQKQVEELSQANLAAIANAETAKQDAERHKQVADNEKRASESMEQTLNAAKASVQEMRTLLEGQ